MPKRKHVYFTYTQYVLLHNQAKIDVQL